MRSALFMAVIVAAAVVLIAWLFVRRPGGAVPHHSRPRATHSIVCQPGPQPNC